MFAIGDKEWPGVSKLVEECGELLQVCGKLMGTGGQAEHWDGSNLHEKFREELADVIAAARFVSEVNAITDPALLARVEKKLERFRRWHELGLTNLLALRQTACVVCAQEFGDANAPRERQQVATRHEAICVGCHEAGK